MRRGQLSLSLLEASIGVVIVFAMVGCVVVGVPTSANDHNGQLEIYANDVATLLTHENASEGTPEGLESRVDRWLPQNLLFRIETPNGTVGYQMPAGVLAGSAIVPTVNGDMTVHVWYV